MQGDAHADARHAQRLALTGVAGGALFFIGSWFFIAQSFATDWLQLYRTGCGCWILGCCPYVLLSIFVGRSQPLLCCCSCVSLNAILQVGGLSCYIAGCVLGFVDAISAVLPHINLLFVIGAACQLVDAVVDTTRRMHRTACKQPMDFTGTAEMVSGTCFCLAAGFGGYGSHISLVRFGMTCWLMGSLGYFSLSLVEYRQAVWEVAKPPIPCSGKLQVVGAQSTSA
eukprot:TRINITY_DN77851_c0_g1_i1.p1 TRINITY_DN77851_c0_g1~~TRINITY_DN77851_c0_g1_i1.p1  ORF type:complete len:226 (+),score=13.82 TRINITY_DN77851_c0_g1_i1:147-824(+)